MSSELLLPNGNFGYPIELENKAELVAYGESPMEALKAYKDSFPKFNKKADPATLLRILNQMNQGACQGHALALIFSICYWLATGRWLDFSRAAAYYLSQRYDGIRGDRGSTLNGGRKVATIHGLCLESDWPYPSSYNPAEPPNVPYLYKLKVTKPFQTLNEVTDWTDAHLPIQTGMNWNATCQREVVNAYRSIPGSGGHSTVFWLRSMAGNVKMPNSWGVEWNGDGINEWTEASIAAVLRDPQNTLIGYAPDGMEYPTPPPIAL
jgi:hypothetical protein